MFIKRKKKYSVSDGIKRFMCLLCNCPWKISKRKKKNKMSSSRLTRKWIRKRGCYVFVSFLHLLQYTFPALELFSKKEAKNETEGGWKREREREIKMTFCARWPLYLMDFAANLCKVEQPIYTPLFLSRLSYLFPFVWPERKPNSLETMCQLTYLRIPILYAYLHRILTKGKC